MYDCKILIIAQFTILCIWSNIVSLANQFSKFLLYNNKLYRNALAKVQQVYNTSNPTVHRNKLTADNICKQTNKKILETIKTKIFKMANKNVKKCIKRDKTNKKWK